MYTENNRRITRKVYPTGIYYLDDMNRIHRVISYTGYVSSIGGNGLEYHPNGRIRLTKNGRLDESDLHQDCMLTPDGEIVTGLTKTILY